MAPRKFRPRRRRSVLSRLSRPKKSTAIQTLAKQVKALKTGMKKDQETVYLGQTINTNLQANVNALSLNDFQTQTKIFNSEIDTTQASAIWKSTGVDVYITHQNTNDEEENVNYTAFLVKLTDDMSPFLSTAGVITLTANQHYYYNNGFAMLNKRYFKIMRVKRFTLGNFGQNLNLSAGQKQYGNDIRWYWKVSPNVKFVDTINNPGTWKGLQRIPDTGSNYFMILFNNNSAVDLEYPRASLTLVSTLQTL